MGKIFPWLSNLPVSTIESALKGMHSVEPPPVYVQRVKPVQNQTIVTLSKVPVKKSNAFLKMRNGIGKLMSHFSKSKNNV